MKPTGKKPWRSLLVMLLMLHTFPVASYSSQNKKQSKAYRDVNAIGHRVIGFQYGLGNWYSLEKEKQIGAQLSAEYEKSTALIRDNAMQAYIDRLTQTISQNSDTQFPITTRLVDSEDSFSVTLAGGYQYISRGLLLKIENEGELAAVIARGVAHTALRSATGLATRSNLMKAVNVPVVPGGQDEPTGSNASGNDLSVALTSLKFSRDDESTADYIGVQYLYKSGYSPECFISFIQKGWPPQPPTTSQGFSLFPPTPERLKALRTEINEILPKQSDAITNTQSFAIFREHLLTLIPSSKTVAKKTDFTSYGSAKV